jgi:type I restriction enzyme M protein
MVGKEGPKQRPVFMAIAEKCGHGRRGETTWVRKPDGTELIETEEVVERREREGKRDVEISKRRVQVKRLADDLPWIADEYRRSTAEAAT